MSEWIIAYFALFGLSAAAAAWTMRKREWSWLGLYVALGYLFGSMADYMRAPLYVVPLRQKDIRRLGR